jgi:hypothetical protein
MEQKKTIRFDLLERGKFDDIPSDQARFFVRHFSGNCRNLQACENIVKKFFYIKPRVVFSMIYFLCDFRYRNKYPKSQHKKEYEEEIARKYLKLMYGWSDTEYDKNKSVLKLNQDFFKDLHSKIGLTKEECKKLGIEVKVEKIKIREKRENDLFSFGG